MSWASRAPAAAGAAGAAPLPLRTKAGYAFGDHAINVQLASISLFFLFFLTEIAGLPPSLAGLVLLAGRWWDAITDPLMGRLSDVTTWKIGRRRPYFLIGALPFGATTALLWATPSGDTGSFPYYVAIYLLNTTASTVLAVPYMSLLPELALGYHERTSLNSFRAIGAGTAVLLTAVSLRPLVELLGGGPAGWERAGLVLGVWVTLPWLLVFLSTWERPGFRHGTQLDFLGGLRAALRHRAYRRLLALFLAARIAVDVVGAMFLFYFTYWMGRPEDFPITIGLMLTAVLVSLPIWLQVAKRWDKRRVFLVGCGWWIAAQLLILWMGPEQPRWLAFAVAAFAGVGYAVADLMPWSMLGDVIDADELHTGERREGVYAGFFTFLRKLGGAAGVAGAGLVLELSGFVRGQPQSETTLLAIRLLTGAAPIAFLAIAMAIALGYPITRDRHAAISAQLLARRGAGDAPA